MPNRIVEVKHVSNRLLKFYFFVSHFLECLPETSACKLALCPSSALILFIGAVNFGASFALPRPTMAVGLLWKKVVVVVEVSTLMKEDGKEQKIMNVCLWRVQKKKKNFLKIKRHDLEKFEHYLICRYFLLNFARYVNGSLNMEHNPDTNLT